MDLTGQALTIGAVAGVTVYLVFTVVFWLFGAYLVYVAQTTADANSRRQRSVVFLLGLVFFGLGFLGPLGWLGLYLLISLTAGNWPPSVKRILPDLRDFFGV